MQCLSLFTIWRKNHISNRSGTLDRMRNIFGHWINESGRYIHKVQLGSLIMLEMFQSRELQRPFARLARRWQIVLSSMFMETHCQFDTSRSTIYMWTSYRCTHMVNNRIHSRKKDTTAADRNAVSKMDDLPLWMTTLEIFFHNPWITLQCNRIAPCIWVEISNNTVYSPFGE